MNAFAIETPKAGEFWLARFGFEENNGEYKIRPVLVLESTPFGTKVAFCGTQKLDSTSARADVLLDAEEAQMVGLQRPTRICFGNRRIVARCDMLRKIGEIGTPGSRLSLLKFREMAQAVQAAGAL